MTQEVLSPSNLECFPTWNVQLCSFVGDFICNASLVLNGKSPAMNFLPDNNRGTKKPYTKPYQQNYN